MFLRKLLPAALALGALAAALPARADPPPLRSAVDGTFAPFAFPKLGGGLQGFALDVFGEVAKRLHRPITFASASYNGLIPALLAGRYDFLAAPTTVTSAMAQNVIFTQGYMWTVFELGLRRDSKPVTSLADLKGRAITVNAGSTYDSWAHAHAAQYGFTVQSYDSNADAIQAVLAGRAYANLAGSAVIRYAATKLPNFVPGYTIEDTRAPWAAPFRKDEVQLRNQVQDALSCMKQDGTLAAFTKKWFGVSPSPTDLERVVQPGYGAPGFPGYDPTPHALHCAG